MTALRSLNRNQPPGSLRPLRLTRTDNTFRKDRSKCTSSIIDIDQETFVRDVDLCPYMVIIHASERLAEVFANATEQSRKVLLWELERPDLDHYVGTDEIWADMVKMMFFGSFTPRTTLRDLDQTMPLRQHFRTTDLLLELLQAHPNPRVLTSPQGLGGLLFFFLTGQSYTTRTFTRAVGFPTNTETITEVLIHWNPDDPDSGLFENSALYGTPQGSLTFAYGVRTDMRNHEHRDRITARFNYYFGEEFCTEWAQVVDSASNWDIGTPNPNPLAFEVLLDFFHRLGVEYGVAGLASGILPLQITNTMVELGLAKPAMTATVSDFVAREQKLGAFRALMHLGFDLAANPSAPVLAFELTYSHVKRLLGENSPLRFTPTDHEHLLCKLARTLKLLGEAYSDREGRHLRLWAHQRLEEGDRQAISDADVRSTVEGIAGRFHR